MVGIEDWSAFVWLSVGFFSSRALHAHRSPSPSAISLDFDELCCSSILIISSFSYFYFFVGWLGCLVSWLVFWTLRDRSHCVHWLWATNIYISDMESGEVFMCDENNHKSQQCRNKTKLTKLWDIQNAIMKLPNMLYRVCSQAVCCLCMARRKRVACHFLSVSLSLSLSANKVSDMKFSSGGWCIQHVRVFGT